MPTDRTKYAAGRYLSLLAVLALIFCSCSRKDSETYIIGYVGSQAGANGAILAAEQTPKIMSSPYKSVKIVGIDYQAVGFNAEKALTTLREAGARVVIDGSGSLLGTKSKKGDPLIIATGPNPQALSSIHDPLESAAAKMADRLWADKIVSVSIVYDLADGAYHKKWTKAFQKYYEKNRGVILKAETIDSLQDGWEEKLPKPVEEALIKETRGLVVVAEAEPAGLIVEEVRKFNKDIPLAIAEPAFPTIIISKAGENLEGATMVDFPPPTSGQSYEKFTKDYAGKFSSAANLTAAAAFDAVGLIVAALGKSKRIGDGLAAQTEYQGILGTARNNSGTFTRETTLGRVSNGQFAPIPAPSLKP